MNKNFGVALKSMLLVLTLFKIFLFSPVSIVAYSFMLLSHLKPSLSLSLAVFLFLFFCPSTSDALLTYSYFMISFFCLIRNSLLFKAIIFLLPHGLLFFIFYIFVSNRLP